MANTITAVIEGPVTYVDHKRGTGKTGNPYHFIIVTVLVGGKATVDVTVSADAKWLGGQDIEVDDRVDFLVEVSSSQYGLRVSAVALRAPLSV